MDFGVALPTYANDGWRLPADQLRRLGELVEELGFSGVWTTEHLVEPPGRDYSRLAPLTTASVLAGATERVQIGTCIMILPMRNPVLVAHRAATLHHLSGGRLTLGFGGGWVEAEYDAVGVPFEERGPRFSEGLDLLCRLFEEDRVTFDGRFYDVEDFRLDPPVSTPPRILVGGGGTDRDGERHVPVPIRRRVARADGWLASSNASDLVTSDWNDIADYLDDQGVEPASRERVVLNWAHVVPNVDGELAREKQREAFRGKDDLDRAMNHFLTGSVEEIHDRLDWYEEYGFDQVILGPVGTDPTDVERQIRLYADLLLDR